MSVREIDHIGVAVHSIERTAALWQGLFGLQAPVIESIEERGVRLAYLDFGPGPSVELIEALNEKASVFQFLKDRGEGIHHLCLLVNDLDGMMTALKQRGVAFVQDKPVRGTGGSRIVFIQAAGAGGVLIELKEPA
jgi:methylmalonyl-CoA/ethylmalonyl-CoA epimerase